MCKYVLEKTDGGAEISSAHLTFRIIGWSLLVSKVTEKFPLRTPRELIFAKKCFNAASFSADPFPLFLFVCSISMHDITRRLTRCSVILANM